MKTGTPRPEHVALARSPHLILKLEFAIFAHVLCSPHKLDVRRLERLGKRSVGDLLQHPETLKRST